MAAVRAALAAENGCDPEALTRLETQIFACPDAGSRAPLARRYDRRDPLLNIVSLGAGVVVSASPALLPALAEIFAGAERDAAFDVGRLAAVGALLAPHGLTLTAPSLRLLCAGETRRERAAPAGVTLELEHFPPDSSLAELGTTRWPHAFRLPVRRTNTCLAVARAGALVVGVAAMSEDAPLLWQIGLDVIADWRGRGVGAALTAALAEVALRADRVPFYAVAPSNIASVATALAAGFRFGWIEAYSTALT